MGAKKILITVTLLSIFASCKKDLTEPVLAEEITGQWEIIEAVRNNRVTKTLNKGLFIITDSTFMTNIRKEGQSARYSYLNNSIELMNTEKSKYKVVRIVADTMYINTTLNNFDFEFKTVRKEIK